MSTSTLKRYDAYQGVQPLGDVWPLTRGAMVLRCALKTHPLGWELRVTSSRTFHRSQVCKSEQDVFDVSQAWEAEAREKGWS